MIACSALYVLIIFFWSSGHAVFPSPTVKRTEAWFTGLTPSLEANCRSPTFSPLQNLSDGGKQKKACNFLPGPRNNYPFVCFEQIFFLFCLFSLSAFFLRIGTSSKNNLALNQSNDYLFGFIWHTILKINKHLLHHVPRLARQQADGIPFARWNDSYLRFIYISRKRGEKQIQINHLAFPLVQIPTLCSWSRAHFFRSLSLNILP